LLNRKLVGVALGEIPRLLVTMPPRHGKSSLCSHYFPAWYLGNYPGLNVILASYEADFAASWGRRARDVLEEHGPPVFGVRVSRDSSAANRWEIAGHGGGMMTAGVGGPLTGKEANVIILDDPVKNDQEANSPTYREHLWEWYRATLYTRLEPGGAIILIQTRWNQDDLAGRLLQEMEDGGERWDVLRFPALAEDNNPLGREPGEPLWPQRFNKKRLQEIRRTISSYWWAALYQQRPAPAPGQPANWLLTRAGRPAPSAPFPGWSWPRCRSRWRSLPGH
jgi:hypothetical protein